jgi:hypothetical protein
MEPFTVALFKKTKYSDMEICRLQTGYKMQTEDKMQTGGELGIFHKFLPSHSHMIVLVDNINVEASHFHQFWMPTA